MTCFCLTPTHNLRTLLPSAQFRIDPIPPQFRRLPMLLDLSAGTRLDLRLSRLLPDLDPDAWMRMTLGAAAPQTPLPLALPFGAGPLMSATMRLSFCATMFPLGNLERLIAGIKQALASFAAGMVPMAVPLRALVTPDWLRLVEAARITLALRGLGLCPLALSGVDGQFVLRDGLDNPRDVYTNGMRLAARLSMGRLPAFALSPAQVQLAAHFAASAHLPSAHESLGLPPVNDPAFPSAAAALLAALSRLPMPHLPMSLADMLDLAGILEGLEAIHLAFGEDALTPAGINRINLMLRYCTRLDLPRLGAGLAVQGQINMLPPFDMIESGATGLNGAAFNIASTMGWQVPDLPIGPLFDALSALAAVLERLMGQSPFGGCGVCDFPIERFLPDQIGDRLP
ncbi:MAG: hypothetical protein AAGE13_00705 [Pseudomonadota bacterium]